MIAHPAIVTRVLTLIADAIGLVAAGSFAQAARVLRRAANQLDEIS